MANSKNLESLGNKALLEKRINIRAADYRFSDKKKYYIGFQNSRKQYKEGTANLELLNMSKDCDDFCERDIESRNQKILTEFIDYLRSNDLLQ